MAIAFARLQYVKRSAGQNACHKAAYNGRMAISNERTGESYNYASKGDSVHHEILLPVGANVRFKDARVLWSEVEKRETRINSQVAKEMVLALPDDACVSFSQKLDMARQFVKLHFVDNGLAIQLDIHEPHEEEDHNWHAHVLMTTRRFTHSGDQLGEKARDLDGEVRRGMLMEAQRWGALWREFQNQYFKEHGIDLRVDENGIVAQAHLGPVRLRARAEAMMRSHLERLSANQNASQDPEKILEHLTERQSIFTREDVERYLTKHVSAGDISKVRHAFWRQKGLIQLYAATEKGSASEDVMYSENGRCIDSLSASKALNKYTTSAVKTEEDRVVRIADRLHAKDGVFGLTSNYSKGASIAKNYSLTAEQLAAFEGAVVGQRLTCIQGRAGTGKSHVMVAIKDMIESNGYRVRGLAPTASVAKDLESKGFEGAQNVHRFLFQQKNGVDPLGRKEILMVDEAGMIGNTVMQELLKVAWDKGAQVLLVGDDRQIPAVDRGGLFKVFCERYGAYELTEVRRQERDWQKEVSETLSQGTSARAVQEVLASLEGHQRLHWNETKEGALQQLVDQWKKDTAKSPESTFFVMEHRNRYALVLNEMIRNVRKERGELARTDVSGAEYRCETFLGTCYVSQGDRIQFRANDRELGVNNGTLGTLIETTDNCFVVKTDEGVEVAFNPKTFNRYQLGYAGTYHQSQGKTVEYAYALHSPYMNHNLFYVGLTRQKQDVHYFVSKDEAKDMNTLSAQLSRDGSKETTVHYLTPKELMASRAPESIFSQALHYVKDKFYGNEGFYRMNDKVRVNADTFRGYAVTPLTAIEARMAEHGDVQITVPGKQRDLIRPAQRTLTRNSRIRPPQSHQIEKGVDARQELDRIVDTLKEKIPEVCRTLFPEAQPQVRGHEWRYGSKGSFKVNVSGPKRGGYANFETGDKGGPLHLICEARNCTMKEAIGWAKDFLNVHDLRDLSSKKLVQGNPPVVQHAEPEPTWKSLRPRSDHPAPQLGEECLAKLGHHHRETARYTYTDEQGNAVFHVVRLEPKDPSKTGKLTLPLSYGMDPSSSIPCWALKKYQSTDNSPLPLYHLKELVGYPSKPVLVVEGEKAADAAQHIFPEMVVTTWHGGAGNVSAADLSPLKGRDVVVWPDNDAPGLKAMETLVQRCKAVGVNSIHMVGLDFGKDAPKLPETWDLADPLPQGITLDMVRQKVQDLGIAVLPSQVIKGYTHIIEVMQQNGYEPYMIEHFKEFFRYNPESAINAYKSVHSTAKGIDQTAINPTIRTLSPERQALKYITELKIAQNTLEYYTTLKQKDKLETQQSLLHSLQKTIIQKPMVMEHLSRLDTTLHTELKRFEQEQQRQHHVNDSKGFER